MQSGFLIRHQDSLLQPHIPFREPDAFFINFRVQVLMDSTAQEEPDYLSQGRGWMEKALQISKDQCAPHCCA